MMSPESLPPRPVLPSQPCAILPKLLVLSFSQAVDCGRWREGLLSLGQPVLETQY